MSLADEINKENVREEITKPQFIPEMETRYITDFAIGVWGEDESSDEDNISPLP